MQMCIFILCVFQALISLCFISLKGDNKFLRCIFKKYTYIFESNKRFAKVIYCLFMILFRKLITCNIKFTSAPPHKLFLSTRSRHRTEFFFFFHIFPPLKSNALYYIILQLNKVTLFFTQIFLISFP